MQNFVYLAKLHEPLVEHEKNLGCSACLFAELSAVIDRANNYSRGVQFSDSAPTASTSVRFTYNYWSYELNRGLRRTQLTVYNSVT